MAKSEVNCKVALVTGASKRIGNGIARKFHEEGYKIVLHYNMSSKDALFLAEELNKKRENSCFPIQFDLGNFHLQDFLAFFCDVLYYLKPFCHFLVSRLT